MKDIIIIPTYNEKENIRNILGRVTGLYPDKEIFVVDDNSPDGTREIVQEIAEKNPHVKLFERNEKTGLGDAYKFIHEKIQKMDDVRYVVTMDADGSHDPTAIATLFAALEKYDLAIGSRYVRGGKVTGWDKKRLALSYFGNIYSNLITGSPVKDGTAGFVAFRAEALRAINLKEISSAGYSYQIEFKGALIKKGKTFTEVPITFSERQVGKSKMSGHIIFEGLLMPWRILSKDRKKLWSRLRLIMVGLVFLGAFFGSTYHLKESPSVWFDEGIYTQSAANLLEMGVMGFQLSPGTVTHISRVSVSYPFMYPLAAWFKVFGVSVLSARSFMVLVFMLFLLVVYLFSRKLYGEMVALGTLLMFATFPPLYGNGKSVLGEVPGLLYLVTGLLFFTISKSRQENKDIWLALAGIFLGLCVVTKPIFIVLAPAVVFGVLIEWKRGALRMRDVFFTAISAALPFFVWLVTQFDTHDSFSAIVGFYVNPYQVQDLLAHILHNLHSFVSDATPLYLLIMLIVWVVAMLVRFTKKADISKIAAEEIICFIFCCLVALAYLRIATLYRYIFPAQIIAIIYFVPSLQIILERLKQKNSLLFIPVIALAVFGLYGLTAHSWVADSYSSHKTAFWEEYFARVSKNSPNDLFFFYNVPELAIFSKNKNYYQFIEPNGGPFSTKELLAIENGIPEKVIIQTAALPDIASRLKKYYRPEEEIYKYTIFKKI